MSYGTSTTWMRPVSVTENLQTRALPQDKCLGSRVTKPGVVLKHKNVSSIEEYNIGDRLKYSRIKQSSKKDIEESRINVKYQEHYRSIWNSAKCKMQSAKYNVQSAKYKVQSAKCKVQYRNFWNNAKY